MPRKPALALAAALATTLALSVLTTAQSNGLQADYDRANSLTARTRNTVYDSAEAPTWIPGGEKFWYRKTVRGGNAFVLVDAVAGTKAPAFDHAKLASAISTTSGGTYTAVTLPFTTFTYSENLSAIDFAIGGGAGGRTGAGGGRGAAPAAPAVRYRCSLTDYTCARQAAVPADAQGGRGGCQGQGQGRGGAGRAGGAPGAPAAPDLPQVRCSPDGKAEAFIENFNVYVRPVTVGGRPAPAAVPLSWDGSEGNYYTLQSIQWSPDSTKIAAYRRRPGYQRMVNYVQSSPADQLQPKASSRYYQKPGDVVDLDQPVLLLVESHQAIAVDNALFPNPYSNSRVLQWRKDGRAFTFEYNQRGHQLYRVIEVDSTTGKARTVIEETSKTFVDYRPATVGLSDSGREFRYDVADGKEIIWMSERDGWSHLYLYDGATGDVKNQITKGAWAVHTVDRVDEPNRQIYFWANGMDPGKDPYFLNYFRVNFDGTGLVRYTKGDGQHSSVSFSTDHQFYVDTYSRVDLPPITELRKASDQSLVTTLETADASDLLATGWTKPEVFVAKGRDGATDIWGVIIKPTNFDPSKKYPVIENIYAGPQGSFVPKTFGTQNGMQTLAELGFIVVQMDGMGTGNRSKAFHDVAWKNLGDAGFPDRMLWHKAVAAKYPWYDVTRVGVYGTSAGGQNAMGAVLFHPEFYKAAAASAGCHDNRMDKLWWNEQWMGWPIGPEYSASSNMENAAKLGSPLFLLVGEMDTNVDPSSTMQVVNRLILANKNFDLLVIPNADHTSGGAYGDHKRFDFFVHHLRGLEPPAWDTAVPPASIGVGTVSVLEEDAMPWVASEDWGRDGQ
jgi:dipeptidyl aminopeptidase/acylaminoacyl peptidase